jgi:hypothetical protein
MVAASAGRLDRSRARQANSSAIITVAKSPTYTSRTPPEMGPRSSATVASGGYSQRKSRYGKKSQRSWRAASK